MRYPADHIYKVTQQFGAKNAALTGGTHNGVDLAFPQNTTVRAITSGTVLRTGYQPNGAGNFVVIKSGDLEHKYFHLQKSIVSPGFEIGEGAVLGYSGKTGLSTGYHLHLETFWKGALVNPLEVIGGKYSTPAPVSQPAGGDFLMIKGGDTFWGLEEALGLQHGTLQQLNPGVDPRKLMVGQKIRMRGESAPAPAPAEVFITVTPGFTMWAYEKSNQIPFGTLQQLNPSVNPRTLRIGSQLRVK